MKNKDKTTLLVIAFGFVLMCLACGGGGAVSNQSPVAVASTPCPRHSDHRLADPHAHNDFRAKLGLPPTEWATRVIADEQAAYLRCVEDMR